MEVPGNIGFPGVSRFRGWGSSTGWVYRPTLLRRCDLLLRDVDPVDVYRLRQSVAAESPTGSEWWLAIMLAKSVAAVALMPGTRCW